ncbi:hypothetical protein DID88_005101 [Monilinia fructigena]|uniref:Uncharacterized protein n=1 Tax=Monilinia fructigena TaxID=38457 RepID=A0A395IR43_9HELO|nr:hypothetical protein DID88_005101 [Monilinia fructigena]
MSSQNSAAGGGYIEQVTTVTSSIAGYLKFPILVSSGIAFFVKFSSLLQAKILDLCKFIPKCGPHRSPTTFTI